MSHGGFRRQRRDALAEGTVADLIVVLKEIDEREQLVVGARLAPRKPVAKGRRFALISKPRAQRAPEQGHRPFRVIGVITIDFAGCRDVEAVVDVVVPLRAVPFAQKARLVGVVFEHQVDGASGARVYGLRQLDQERPGALVENRVHGVEA